MANFKQFLGAGSCQSDVDKRTKTTAVEGITTIQLKKTTHEMLISLGYMGESFDDVVNRLAKDHGEVDKYIQRYIGGAKGKCINKVVLGHHIVAHHEFDCELKCIKCGIQGPIELNRINDKPMIVFGEH